MEKLPNDILDISLESLSSADTATMNVIINGKPSGWLWEFAGPGHDKALAQANRTARESLQKSRLIEQAQVNGKKWVAPDREPSEVRDSNVTYVVERMLGWTPIKLDGELTAFTEAKARELLSDPRRASILAQAMEFLAADSSFTQRSTSI